MGEGETVKRSVIAMLIALMVVAVICLSMPSRLPPKPMGILLPTALPRNPISIDQVSFYDILSAPRSYQNLGSINVQYHAKRLTLEGEQCLKKYIMQMAAQIGANGVIVTLFGHTVPEGSVMSSYFFQGIAIYHSMTII